MSNAGPWRPGHLMHMLFRAPAWLYEHNLGWLLGRRFMCVTHVGRRSGRRYRTVLEVVGTKAEEIFVVVGFGLSTDWYRNIQANPPLEVVTRRRRIVDPAFRELQAAEAAAVIADYEHRNRAITPVVRVMLGKLVGWRYDGSPEARERLVHQLPVLGFGPA